MANDLENFIAAFESARASDLQTDLTHFLPAQDHPLYGAVLAELIRVDLEFGWQQGRPKSLEDYRRRFPQLAEDLQLWPAISFEEYRLRRQAGENASPEDYRARLGSVVDDWPILEKNGHLKTTDFALGDPDRSSESSNLVNTQVLSIQPLVHPEFVRGALANGRKDDGLSAWPSMGSQDHSDEIQELSRSQPEMADRLVRTLQQMPEVGSQFEGFQLLAELGRGAFGRVFLAQQNELAGRLVALKISTDLFHESQTLAQLQHTNIVPIYSAHRADPFQALCMPYLGSTTLADLLRIFHSRHSLPVSGRDLVSTLNQRKQSTLRHGRKSDELKLMSDELEEGTGHSLLTHHSSLITPSTAGELIALKKMEELTYVQAVLWIGSRLADGLAHAHEHHIIHRDLKPANVLLADDGQPLLLDFNLSENQNLRSTALGASIGGTLPYMAPEHLEYLRRPVIRPNARSDIYSLGLILYELLTGTSAYPCRQGPWQQVLSLMVGDRQKPPPRIREKTVPLAVESIIRRCLEPDPERRYRSSRELQEDMERQLENRPLRFAPEPSLRERAQKWMRRHPRFASSTSVGLVALILIATLAGSLVIRGNRLGRFQALENWSRFQEDMRLAQFVLYGRAPDRQKLDLGIDLCRQALDRYQVLQNADWRRAPEVRRLPDGERHELQAHVGELLFLTARANSAKASYDPAHPRRDDIVLALKLSQSAAGCYDSGQVPQALWQLQAELFKIQGQVDQASALLQKADQTPLRTSHDYYLAAQLHASKGNFRKAWPLLEEAVQLDPQNFSAWFVLANCHDELQHRGGAVACYSTCIALRPGYHWSWFNRGLAHLRQGNCERAVADFDQTIRLKPDLADAYLNRGLAHEGLAHYPDAIRDLTTALDLGTPRTQVYFLSAAVREKAKDQDGAKRDWQLGMRLQPADEQSWVARGLARQQTDPKGALADFDQALIVNPRSFPALQNKAHVLADLLKDDREAVVVLDAAVAMFPDSAMARAGRGVSLARTGDRPKALADAGEALLMDSSPQNLYQVGCIYALTSKNHPEDRIRALELLSYALKDGFGLDLVDTDTDLDPLRLTPEFRRLVNATKDLHGVPTPPR